MRQRREIAQLQIVFARNVIRGTDGRKHFRLLHRVDPEIRFQIQIEIEHIRRIAGLLGNDLHHLFLHRISRLRSGRLGGATGADAARRRGRGHCRMLIL